MQTSTKRKTSVKKNTKKSAKYQSANIVERNIYPNQKTSAGSSNRTRYPIRHPGNQQKAPEGAQGPN
jgi:hypothetical protein